MQPIPHQHELRFVGHRNHTGVDDRTLRKLERRGVLTRLWRGAYVPTEVWGRLPPEEQQRLAVAAAVAATGSAAAVSHRSAAALWGVPLLKPPGGAVDVLTTVGNGSRTEHGFARHATTRPDLAVIERHGLRLTSVERTVIDLALTEPFGQAVVAADWALSRGIERDALLALLDAVEPGRRRPRALRALRFADGRSGSPGESVSRVLIHEMGFPAPEMQVEFSDRRGFVGIVDFFWPAIRLIGEFDGLVKYQDPVLLKGRTAAQAVIAEKRREDRLRSAGNGVVRWLWSDLDRPRLGAILTEAGLRPLPAR